MNQSGGGGAAPTGCYKCGRPGHWSRDCPSDPNTSETNNNGNRDSALDPSAMSRPPLPAQKPKQKPPRKTSRPKLTPDLLLSDAGIGHILRYFPPAFKYRGRGHEVDDLQHLLRMYGDWHSRLRPYYNFEQFVDKVEQVGTAKRVKVCLRELRERVSNGIDPMKLQEPQVQQDAADEQDTASGLDMPSNLHDGNIQIKDDNNLQEDMPQSIWEKVTEEPSQLVQVENASGDASRADEVLNQTTEANPGNSNKNLMSEEQIARMEANRLRALERAVARSRSLRA